MLAESSQQTIAGVIVLAILAPTWMAWWNSRLAKKQIQPNGGSSLKDQVTDIVDKMHILAAKADLHYLTQKTQSKEIELIKDAVSDMRGSIFVLQMAQEQRREIIEQETEQEAKDNPT